MIFPRRRLLALSLPLGLWLLGGAGAPAAAQDQPAAPVVAAGKATPFEVRRQPTEKEEIIARAAVRLLEQGHFVNPVLNDDASRQLFDTYFEMLDPNRIYFLAEDLEEFSPYRLILDDLLSKRGNLEFAFEVYARFLKRVEDRIEHARQRLAEPFEFVTDEVMVLDRSKENWARDRAELDEIWRQRLKNQMLLQELLRDERARREAAGGKPAPKPKGKPADEVLRSYTSYHRLLTANDTYDIMELYLTALCNVYDPHSAYLNWRNLEDFNIDMSLSLQGIGAVLQSEEGYTKVTRVIPGGPAELDNRLKPGDYIVAVGQAAEEPVDVVNVPLQKVVRLIRGEKGTKVHLTILKTLDGLPQDLDLVRGEVKLQDAAARGELKTIKDATGRELKIGYVILPSFYADWEGQRTKDPTARSATTDVQNAIEKLQKEHQIAGLVLDLRGDGGGSLDEAIFLSGLFIPDGPMVQIRHAQGLPQIRRDEDKGFAFNLPLVVMTDRSSASASEIFAGAIQDYGRGIILGDAQTHGKGTVQTVLRLNRFDAMKDANPGALKYTMAKFYRVTGHSTQLKGVQPDIILPSFYDSMDIGETHLKNCLPWDEIPALAVRRSDPDVSKLAPRLKAESAGRLAHNEAFQKLVAEIQRFGTRRQMKTLALNKEKREALRKEDEYWAKRTAAVLFGNRRNAGTEPPPEGPDGEPLDPKDLAGADFYLDEALAVTGDLIRLIRDDQGAKDAR